MWTDDQRKAIDIRNSNVLVSAAAGSGKTAVLSERVLHLLKEGVNVDQLIILTFTNAASIEMKERIIKKIKQDPSLADQLKYVDSANITTFDAYSLSLVKKYYYKLGLNEQISIGERVIFDRTLKQIIKDTFEQKIVDTNFRRIMAQYLVIDAQSFFDMIFSFYYSYNNLVDKNINIEEQFESARVDHLVASYLEIVSTKKSQIDNLITQVFNACVDDPALEYLSKHQNVLDQLLALKDYDTLKTYLDDFKTIRVPMSKKISNLEILKPLVKQLGLEIKELGKLCQYSNQNMIRASYTDTYEYCVLITNFIKDVDQSLSAFKVKHGLYDYPDIKRYSIELLQDNPQIANEIRTNTYEILLDEYQDTDDIQEHFIGLISSDNVYMVGDLKQAIYRFRNANPDIFMSKYKNYSQQIGGQLITLAKNFRSNKEVIDCVNHVCENLFELEFGNVDYIDEQRLVYGNSAFDAQEANYNLEVLRIDEELDQKMAQAISVAKDIKDKISNNYKVIKDKKLVLATYKDFAILLRSKDQFEMYRKVFEVYEIPIQLHSDYPFKLSYDVLTFKNICKLIYARDNLAGPLMGLLNSYLYDFSPDFIDSVMSKYNARNIVEFLDSFNDVTLSEISAKLMKLAKLKRQLSYAKMASLIIKEFNFLQMGYRLEDGEYGLEKLTTMILVFKNFDTLGYKNSDLLLFLDDLQLDSKFGDVSFNVSQDLSNDVVNIMTIHKSKGLEFNVVYLANLAKKFNKMDLQKRNVMHIKYGFVISHIDDYLTNNFVKKLIEQEDLNQMLSEELRLIYVAMTRAQSQVISVANLDYDNVVSINLDNKRGCNSYLDLFNLLAPQLKEFERFIDISDAEIKAVEIGVTPQMLDAKTCNSQEVKILDEITMIQKLSASKKTLELKEQAEIKKMDYGTKLHRLFESVNLENVNYEILNENESLIIRNFLDQNLLAGAIKVIQEYQFFDVANNVNGIIDLLVEKQNQLLVIDYKAANIDDPAYDIQLEYYKQYLTQISDKKISLCLYSVKENRYRLF